MTQKLNPLALYAGLDISYSAISTRVSLLQAVSRFFNKMESVLDLLPKKTSRKMGKS